MERHHLNLKDSAYYRICMQGVFDAYWLDMLSGVWAISSPTGSPNDVTILVGCVVDQAALIGDIEQLYSLGLPLLLVEHLPAANSMTAE